MLVDSRFTPVGLEMQKLDAFDLIEGDHSKVSTVNLTYYTRSIASWDYKCNI